MTHRIRAVLGIDSLAIEQEADRIEGFALTLAECIHELRKSSRALDLEKHLVIIVRHFDIEVFRSGRLFVLMGPTSRGVVALVRHCSN